MNKYRAKPTTINGIKYASMFEAKCANDLEILLKQGKIKAIERQVPFVLIPKPNLLKYVADFVVTTKTGIRVVVEAKGQRTPLWVAKEKLFRHLHPNDRLAVWTSKERDVSWLGL